MSAGKVHFKLLCDSNGKVIGVEPPEGETLKIDGESLLDNPVNGMVGIENINVLKKAGSAKVCCIVVGGITYCWC